MLLLNSSPAEYEGGMLGDQVVCLRDPSIPLDTDEGIKITATLEFFTGYH